MAATLSLEASALKGGFELGCASLGGFELG